MDQNELNLIKFSIYLEIISGYFFYTTFCMHLLSLTTITTQMPKSIF